MSDGGVGNVLDAMSSLFDDYVSAVVSVAVSLGSGETVSGSGGGYSVV